MQPTFNFDSEAFNRAVGSILNSARIRTKLSIVESCSGINFSTNDLKEVEAGLRSLPGNILYKLFQKYHFTQEEMTFFCFIKETRQRFTRYRNAQNSDSICSKN